MEVIGFIVITNTDDETGGGKVIDVESVDAERDGAFVYKGVRHGTDIDICHKQYEQAKLHKTIGPALASAVTWVGH